MTKTANRKRCKVLLILSFAVAILLLGSVVFSGCSKSDVSGTTGESSSDSSKTQEASGKKFDGHELILSGSTTLLQVSEAWAAAFMEEYGGTIIINGGGSGGGIADMINRINNLASTSRQIKDKEKEEAKTAGLDVQEYTVLYDGIAVIISKNVSVNELTIKQLSKMYTGEITNWSEVGGEDLEIVLIARDSSSGTGEYFLESVVQLGKTLKKNDYSVMALRLQSNADIVNQVKDNDNTIGYIGLGYLDDSLKVVKIEGVTPSIETVKDGSYPISRGLYVYSPNKDLSEIAQAYLDFVLSEEGQQIGLREGFVPVSK
ncbi:MAG: phosphate ABC transporter substrate-binding protein [Actinobacteria bacterium]|nr:phosphate ABC transporter substrate-binding protein [Actinomycetota bacterium]